MTDIDMSAADEWEARFKTRIIARLMQSPTEWTIEAAQEAAQNEFDCVTVDLTDNPEWSADECLSYWDDDGDAS